MSSTQTTQPAEDSSIHARKGWHYLTWQMGSHLPYTLTHGAHTLRAIYKMTGGR